MLAELIPNTNGSSLTFYRLDEQHIQYKRQGKKLPDPKGWNRIGVDNYLPAIGLNDINDDNPDTDSVLALSYTDFLGNFPGPFVNLALTLAELSITPTSSYTGTTLTLNGEGAIGYEVMGDQLLGVLSFRMI